MAVDNPLPTGHPPPLAEPVLTLRAAVERTTRDLLRIPDQSLTAPWRWMKRDMDVRYGYYRLFETVEEATVDVSRALDALAILPTVGARMAGQASATRWALHGALTWTEEADLDRDPGGDEWPIRLVVGHMIRSQRRYTARVAYALHRVRHERTLPAEIPDDVLPQTTPEEESRGSLDEIRARLDEVVDTAIGIVGSLDTDDDLHAPTAWSNVEVTARFLAHRMSSHLHEHTIHLDKTYALLDHQPREVERLVRLILTAYGSLEAICCALRPATLELTSEGTGTAPIHDVLAHVAETFSTHAEQLSRSAAA